MVWCWDTERLQQMLGSGKNQLRIIPETLLYPKADDSIRLLQVSDGYEIQHWKANHLRHSQGYRAYPTTAEWLLFQRESGTPLDKQRPLPEQALQFEWNKHPWLKNTGETGVQPRGVLLEYILGTLTVALLAGTTAWLATQSLYLTQEISSRDTHLKSLEQTLRPLREARQSAMGALARSKELSRLDPYPDQFVILGKLANLLPQNTGTYIREWEYQSGKLKLTLSVSNASAQLQEFIDALQNSEGFFQNIVGTAATDGKSMVLELDISPQSDPK